MIGVLIFFFAFGIGFSPPEYQRYFGVLPTIQKHFRHEHVTNIEGERPTLRSLLGGGMAVAGAVLLAFVRT